MGEFRIGRTHAQHFYPVRRLGGGDTPDLARNFASTSMLKDNEFSNEPVFIQWSSIGTDPPYPTEVPITPLFSGVIEISGVLNIDNEGVDPYHVIIRVYVNEIEVPVTMGSQTTIAGGSLISIPFLAQVGGLDLDEEALVTVSVETAEAQEGTSYNSAQMAVQEVVPNP